MPEYALRLSETELARYEFMARTALELERDLWEAAGVVEGASVADIGCGPGAISVALADLVGRDGQVLAVDRDPGALEAAKAAAARAGVENVSVSEGDADATGLPAGSVDVVMVRHVLAHNGGREEAIVRHAAGLVRPGGSVYLVDIDAAGFRARPSEPDLDDLNDRYRQWHDQKGNDLAVGLRLGELLAAAGLDVVDYRGRYQIFSLPPGVRPPAWAARDAMVAAGVATAGDVARWGAALDRLDGLQPPPTLFVPLFFAVGRRPAAPSPTFE